MLYFSMYPIFHIIFLFLHSLKKKDATGQFMENWQYDHDLLYKTNLLQGREKNGVCIRNTFR